MQNHKWILISYMDCTLESHLEDNFCKQDGCQCSVQGTQRVQKINNQKKKYLQNYSPLVANKENYSTQFEGRQSDILTSRFHFSMPNGTNKTKWMTVHVGSIHSFSNML